MVSNRYKQGPFISNSIETEWEITVFKNKQQQFATFSQWAIGKTKYLDFTLKYILRIKTIKFYAFRGCLFQ